MNTKHKIYLLILLILLVAAAVGMVYSISASNTRINSLNYVIFYEGERHKTETAGLKATQSALQSALSNNQTHLDELKKQLEDTNTQLSASNDMVNAQKKKLMCESTIPFVDYSNDHTVGVALKEYTSDYKVTDDYYEAIQKNAGITYHRLRSNRTESFFIVFFADGDNGRVNAVFDVLGQCWVNVDNK